MKPTKDKEMEMDMEMEKLLLENKYQLAWNEYGAVDGEPVFYFHGMPGSRLEAKPADEIAGELNIRLICADRPGYGDSDLQPDFKTLYWPHLVARLADKLNIDQFSILSFSGGGSYALACAHELSDRIKKVTLISSAASFETAVTQNSIHPDFKPLYELAASDYDATLQQLSALVTSPETLLDLFEQGLPSEDRDILDKKTIRAHYLENLTLAIKNGIEGFVCDLRCFSLPWQFSLQDIQTDIDIWHGQRDRNVGFPVAKYLADTLNNTSTNFLDNKGHIFLFDQWQEVLQSIND